MNSDTRPGRHVGRWFAVGLVATVVAWIAIVNSHWWSSRQALAAFARIDAEEKQTQDKLAASQASRAREDLAAAEKSRADDARHVKEAAAKRAELDREHAAAVAAMREKTPAERLKEIRTACPDDDCDRTNVSYIVEAASSDAERQTLTTLVASIEAKGEQARRRAAAQNGRATRKAFADGYETTLLDRHMNPDGVSTSGDNATTLVVRGWFCSRQYLYDAQKSGFTDQATSAGFKRIECYSGAESAWLDL